MNLESLKEFLGSRYQGSSSFLKQVIFPIFGEEDFDDGFETELLDTLPERRRLAQATGIRSVKQVGKVYVGVEPLQIFDVTVSDRVMMERNRVNIQRLIRSVMDQFSCAFMLFHYNDDTRWDWRFTYCRKSGSNEETTDSKRYTFLLGPGQSCRTAADNFMALYEKRETLEITDIEDAFNVEALSKEFFGKYKAQYEAFVNYMANPANGMRQHFTDTNFNHTGMTADEIRDREEKPMRDYVKKLLGRIVFLHFLQKKGWLGVPAGKEWGQGDRNFMLNLFRQATTEQQENFLDQVLEKLFAEGLDRDRSQQADLFDTQVEGFRQCRIPYLNGGLFERDQLDKNPSHFPASYFDALLTMLSQYNFTIDENDPNDAEVGVDPEMLGRIFENLLEDNKDKGAFYTPKEVVQYMCRESLIAYLQTNRSNADQECIRQFVTTHDAELLGSLKEEILQCLRKVKICDPAIGSGAFPMGLLRELFFCRSAIEPNMVENAAKIKLQIIQNNIYGVDIEQGAVEIARLRFWLSIIVDEPSPAALPNLDYKIMRGNSLLTTFCERYINLDTKAQHHHKVSEMNKEKRNLYALKQQHYSATGEEKLRLNVEIKKSILRLIAHQLGFESRSWLQNNVQELDAFTTEQVPFSKVRQQLPPEQQQTIQQCEELYNRLCNTHIALSERSQTDIRFFSWRMMFTEVFDATLSQTGKEGFDIVIGNPPYIQLQGNGGLLARTYERCGYQTFARTADIYCLFYERGWQLLRQGGHLCYITSNKWMRAGYGEKTRAFFANNTNPMLLIDFAGVKIFESATVDTNILLFAKQSNQHQTRCTVTNKQSKESIKNLSDFVQQQSSICSFATSDSWVILSPIEQSIKRKIEAVGTPLKDWDIQINYGIKTGYNEAFIISTEKRNEILSNCLTDDERQRTEELIRPILRGRDIKRYGYDWANLWLIYIPWHFPYQFDESIQGASAKAESAFMKQYPAVYSHMLQYKEPLSKRNKAETGIRYEWYAMQRWGAKYWEDFNKPKIVWASVGATEYSFVPEKFMLLDTNYFFASEDTAYLLAMLNSKLITWWINQEDTQLGSGGAYRHYKYNFERLHIPDVDTMYDDAINNILTGNNVESNKTLIDNSVYDTYHLTPEEKAFIESQHGLNS